MEPILGRSNSIQRYIVNFEVYGIYLLIVHLKSVCPFFGGVEPSKRRPFPFKTRVIKGFQVLFGLVHLWICLGNFLMLQPLKQKMRVKFD